MTALSNFRFNTFVATSGSLIAEYAAEEGNGKKPSFCIRIQQALQSYWYPQLSVQAQWKSLWQPELEAEKFVDSVISTKRIRIHLYSRLTFANAVHFLLVEMAKAPLEKEFLEELLRALYHSDKTVTVCNYGSSRLHHGKAMVLSLNLTERTTALCKNRRGKLSIHDLCHRTVLAHEFLHAHQQATGVFTGKPEAFCRRWTNQREMVTIQGDGDISPFSEKFSENAFALARGEPERLSHSTFCIDPKILTKPERFYQALHHGVDLCDEFTVDELESLDEEEVANALTSEITDMFQFSKDRQAYGMVCGGKAAVTMRLDALWSPGKVQKLEVIMSSHTQSTSSVPATPCSPSVPGPQTASGLPDSSSLKPCPSAALQSTLPA